jgi:hypothetical protein
MREADVLDKAASYMQDFFGSDSSGKTVGSMLLIEEIDVPNGPGIVVHFAVSREAAHRNIARVSSDLSDSEYDNGARVTFTFTPEAPLPSVLMTPLDVVRKISWKKAA